MNRRQFGANIVLAVGGVLGLGLLSERLLAFLYPVVPRAQILDVPVIARSAIPPNGGIVVHHPTGHFALEDVGGEVRAYSAVCTHLGCVVKWQPAGRQTWFCACHNGRYDRDGEVVGGPPPRPLPRLPVTVRDGQVYLRVSVRPPAMSV